MREDPIVIITTQLRPIGDMDYRSLRVPQSMEFKPRQRQHYSSCTRNSRCPSAKALNDRPLKYAAKVSSSSLPTHPVDQITSPQRRDAKHYTENFAGAETHHVSVSQSTGAHLSESRIEGAAHLGNHQMYWARTPYNLTQMGVRLTS